MRHTTIALRRQRLLNIIDRIFFFVNGVNSPTYTKKSISRIQASCDAQTSGANVLPQLRLIANVELNRILNEYSQKPETLPIPILENKVMKMNGSKKKFKFSFNL